MKWGPFDGRVGKSLLDGFSVIIYIRLIYIFFFSSPSRLWNFFKFINTRSMGRNKVGWG